MNDSSDQKDEEEENCEKSDRWIILVTNIIKVKSIDPDLQDMLHSLFQDLCAPCPW